MRFSSEDKHALRSKTWLHYCSEKCRISHQQPFDRWIHRTWIWYTTVCGVLQERVYCTSVTETVCRMEKAEPFNCCCSHQSVALPSHCLCYVSQWTLWPHTAMGLLFHVLSWYRRKWQLTDTDLCPCGETQTMSHIVESCPRTKLNGGLSRLHSADEDAVSWLTNYGKWHAYEKKKKKKKLILKKFLHLWFLLFDCFLHHQSVTCLICLTRYGHYIGEVENILAIVS